MKIKDQLKPNFGPVYAAAMYPDLARIAQSHGYALAVHGSLARDLDLVAIPWAEELSPVESVLKSMTEEFSIEVSADSPARRNYGRVAYTLICGFGHCQIDISFFPYIRTP